MAQPTTLIDPVPSATSAANITIGHTQLRDLLLCPRERGIVNYVRVQSIYEHDILDPNATSHRLNLLSFYPNAIASLILPDNTQLLAAGGADAELDVSLYEQTPESHSRSTYTDHDMDTSNDQPSTSVPRNVARSRQLWKFDTSLHGSINNAVTLDINRSHESAVEPRVTVSNNDCTIKFYDVAVRAEESSEDGGRERLVKVGDLNVGFPVNHASMSPDGRTLLAAGDSSKILLHRVGGSGRQLTFTPTTALDLPPLPPPSRPAACFSTTFSNDGMQFAVGSQEGVVAVWDIRSSNVLQTFYTDRVRKPRRHWMEDQRLGVVCGEMAHGFGVRAVKFHAGSNGQEFLTFTEHTSILHVVDAKTYDAHDVIRIPSYIQPRLAHDNPHVHAHTHPMPPLPGSAAPGTRRRLTPYSSTRATAALTTTTRPRAFVDYLPPLSAIAPHQPSSSSSALSSFGGQHPRVRRLPADVNSLSAMTENMMNGVRNVDDALHRFLLRARSRQNTTNTSAMNGNALEQNSSRPPIYQMDHPQREQWAEAWQSNSSLRPFVPFRRAAIPVAWTAAADQQEGSSSGGGSSNERSTYARLRLRDVPLVDRNAIAARAATERTNAFRRAIATTAGYQIYTHAMRNGDEGGVSRNENGEWERTSARLRGEARARAARRELEEEANGEDELEGLLGSVRYLSSSAGVGSSSQVGNGGVEDGDGEGEEELEEDELEASENIEVDEIECIMPTSSSLSPPPLRDGSPSSTGSSSDSGLPSFATAFGPEPTAPSLSGSGRRRRMPAGASTAAAAAVGGSGSARHHHEEHYEYDVHLAGACFSPNGSHVYVGSVAGISEWQVRDHGMKWYSGGAWA